MSSICTREDIPSVSLIINHEEIISQDSNQFKESQNSNIESSINPTNTLPPHSENKFYSPELLIIYVVLFLLLAFNVYQYLNHRSIIHKLNKLNKSRNMKSSTPNPQRATEMNPKTGTGNYHHLPPEEMIDPGNHSTLSNHHTSPRKPFNTEAKASTTAVSTKQTPKQTEPPKQTQKEEIKKDKEKEDIFDKKIALYQQLESLSRKIKRECEDDRDHFSEFAKKNIELKKSLENIIVTMDSLTPQLLGEEKKTHESHIRGLVALLVNWKNIFEEYNIVPISLKVGEKYSKYNPKEVGTEQSVDTNEKEKNDTIAEIVQEGYLLESRVLYPAMVRLYRYKSFAE